MNNQSTPSVHDAVESLFSAPAREYAHWAIGSIERIASVHVELLAETGEAVKRQAHELPRMPASPAELESAYAEQAQKAGDRLEAIAAAYRDSLVGLQKVAQTQVRHAQTALGERGKENPAHAC